MSECEIFDPGMELLSIYKTGLNTIESYIWNKDPEEIKTQVQASVASKVKCRIKSVTIIQDLLIFKD